MMATSAVRTPSIPEVTGGDVRAVLGAVKEVVEVREGRRGDGLDRFATVRDLIAWGVITAEQAAG